jgi:hypothetical protein
MKRGEVTMHEFEDERPIPLGRAAAVDRPAATAMVRPVAMDESPAASLSTAVDVEPATRPVAAEDAPVAAAPATHIEKTRAEAAPKDDVPAAPSPSTVESAPIVVAEPPAGPRDVVPAAVVADTPSAPAAPAATHPLGALAGFRFHVELVEPAVPVRDLARFLVAYVVVAAFVLGLIAAFLTLTARTHA